MKKLPYFLALAFCFSLNTALSAQSKAQPEPSATTQINAPIQDPVDLDAPPPVGLLGGGDIKIEEASLYPNPGDGLLRIKLGGQTKGRIQVYNMAGQAFFDSEIDPLGKKDPEVDLRHLPNGVYVVRVGEKFLKYRKI
jgi:hypothetical protein